MTKKPAPPKETKGELITEVRVLLLSEYSLLGAVNHLLEYFTSLDLTLIRDELRKPK